MDKWNQLPIEGHQEPKCRLSKPLALLETFSEHELLRFERLLASRYLIEKEEPYLLLTCLKKFVLNKATFDDNLKLKVFNTIFKRKKKCEVFDTNQNKELNRELNELRVLAEQFLKIEALMATDEYDIELLLPELSKRNQMPLYEKHRKAFLKRLDSEKKQGVKYQRQFYKMEAEKARLLFIENQLHKEDNYDELQKHLDTKYLLEKLQYHLAKVTLKDRFGHKDFNFEPFNALKKLLEQPDYESNTLIKLYVLNINLRETHKEEVFIDLLKQLKEKQAFIPSDYLKPFYTNLTNYCTYQLNEGYFKYYNHQYKIYEVMHEGNLLTKNNVIDIRLLKNIITTACKVNAFDWATEILDHYEKFIPKKIRHSILEYNKGVIAFNQQNYDKALTHFKVVNKVDDTYDLSFRIIQLKCYFETDIEFDPNTIQLLKSLRAYIKQNKKLKPQQKEAYLNFIKIYNELYKFKKIRNKKHKKMTATKTKSELKEHLLEQNLISEKQWLLSKIEEATK